MSEYLLGHGPEEWARLDRQHELWRHTLLADLDELGLGPGQALLEIGCGNGALLANLADLIGPEGCVCGVERDPDAAAAATRRVADRSWVTTATADLTTWQPDTTFDWIVARWVLSFVARPGDVIWALAEHLRPGGHLVVQDYVHDGLLVWPRRASIDAVIEGFRTAYRETGGGLWVAAGVPGHLEAAGLEVDLIEPHVQAGKPGSPPFEWVGEFLLGHVHTLVGRGVLTATEEQHFRSDWAELVQRRDAVLFTPQVVTVAGRRSDH